MAAYEVLASEPTLQVLAPEIVVDATRITARALASGVVFTIFYTRPTSVRPDTYESDADRIARGLAYWAGIWDTNAAVPGVVNIGMSQEVDAAGQLKDQALVVVESSSARSTGQVILTPARFMPPEFAASVAAERQLLDAVEASGPLVAGGTLSPTGAMIDLAAEPPPA